MAEAKAQRERPLSPHLQIFRPMINMVMSIFHRITGFALYFGTLLLAWWLIAAAAGPDHYNYVREWLGSISGQIVLFGFTWAIIHHLLGGVRHLIWDTGRGFALRTIGLLSWGTIILSVALTVFIWGIIYLAAGAL